MELDIEYDIPEGVDVSTYTRIAPAVTNYGMYVATDKGTIKECEVKNFTRIGDIDNE